MVRQESGVILTFGGAGGRDPIRDYASGGVPETTREDWREAITQSFVDTSMLKRVETLEDVGNVAAFAASDLARTMTATSINITCGRVAD
jgi:enoyl-[acyl-carrier-protein] reductase (NADH)